MQLTFNFIWTNVLVILMSTDPRYQITWGSNPRGLIPSIGTPSR